MKILITGGAGFIGSALVRKLVKQDKHTVINIDKLTYAGNLDSLTFKDLENKYHFHKVDICSRDEIREIFDHYRPDCIIHLAAESHVDKSIGGPESFIRTNILGTFTLLEVVRDFLNSHGKDEKDFKFLHVSTDEVYGDLTINEDPFNEEHKYAPSSPYSSSKASSDHLVRAWYRTYGLPILITNCSNNYGPFQFPEKLIPNTIISAIRGKSIPIYGNGEQIRDWLYVDDHVEALLNVLEEGTIGQTYNVGGGNEIKNIDVVNQICDLLDEFNSPNLDHIGSHKDLIDFVEDRPGHDKRYAINNSKIKRELSWTPKKNFKSGIHETVLWYLQHQNWWKRIFSGDYKSN